MGDNWDDDDFEPEVSTLVRPTEPEPIVVKPVDLKEKPKAAVPPKKAPAFAMESLGRELTAAEKEAIQKKNDLKLAKEMFGDDGADDDASYANISTKDEFEYWGERVGGFLATRNKATHYGDMVGKLLIAITENLTTADIQKMSNLLKQISDSKKASAKKDKSKPAAVAATTSTKKGQKASLKVTKGSDNLYDDYGDDEYDDYDDFIATPSDNSDDTDMYEDGKIQILRCTEDDIALRISAERSRVPFDRITEHELSAFPELWGSRAGIQVFLHIRNTALRLWLSNPIEELTICDLRGEIQPPFNSDPRFIENVHHYLTRNGIINVGKYKRSTGIPQVLGKPDKKVIVIGAGISGISAALQLISFGFDVTIVEARNRIGGRVHSIVQDGEVMEVGGDTIKNSRSNALTVLIQQLNVEPLAVSDKIPIYDKGKLVEDTRDRLIANMYCSSREALDVICHNKPQKEGPIYISRQRGFENMLNLVERDTLVSNFNYWKTNVELSEKREHFYKEMKNCREIALLAERQLNEVDPNDHLLKRSMKRDLNMAIMKFESAYKEYESYERCILNYKKFPNSKQYMHPYDYRIYNAFLGFEEISIGAPLEKVQLSCNAIKDRLPGANIRLKGGISNMFEQLIQERDMDIRFEHRVRKIDYNDDVKITVEHPVTKPDGSIVMETEELEAKYCVCTLPIGVLKRVLTNDPETPVFDPLLDCLHCQSICNMGNGCVNKVVMLFERAFWESNDRHTFFNVPASISGRGEFVYFEAVPESRVLTTYLAGFSAESDLLETAIVSKIMTILSTIFAQSCPKNPLKVHITKYQSDVFSYGTGSFMGLKTEEDDYENLTKPLENNHDENRVYFAGEHTSFQYGGTMQGAWLSGLRAASQIASDVYGINHANYGEDVEFISPQESHDVSMENGVTA
ncbi:unnamed protein product [Caenorhabditis bovis]|uniref:SWIRM domain-containing protein n=1 Tax=Caenorhabditis bovis TaxID=2654633 RepID=A0A8S1FCL9_9PELO|nr:unnamed protein product [Caenorhabditis bovis]